MGVGGMTDLTTEQVIEWDRQNNATTEQVVQALYEFASSLNPVEWGKIEAAITMLKSTLPEPEFFGDHDGDLIPNAPKAITETAYTEYVTKEAGPSTGFNNALYRVLEEHGSADVIITYEVPT